MRNKLAAAAFPDPMKYSVGVHPAYMSLQYSTLRQVPKAFISCTAIFRLATVPSLQYLAVGSLRSTTYLYFISSYFLTYVCPGCWVARLYAAHCRYDTAHPLTQIDVASRQLIQQGHNSRHVRLNVSELLGKVEWLAVHLVEGLRMSETGNGRVEALLNGPHGVSQGVVTAHWRVDASYLVYLHTKNCSIKLFIRAQVSDNSSGLLVCSLGWCGFRCARVCHIVSADPQFHN